MSFELSFIFSTLSAYFTNGKPSENDVAASEDTDMDGDNNNGAGLCIGGVHLRKDGATAATQNGIADDAFVGDIGEIVYYNRTLADVPAKKVLLLLFRKWIGGEDKSDGAGYVEAGPGGVTGVLLHLAPDTDVWAQNASINVWQTTNRQFTFKPMIDTDAYSTDPLVVDGSYQKEFPLVNAPGGYRAVRFNGFMGMYTTEFQLTAYAWTLFFVIRPRGDASGMAWPTHSNTANVDPNTCAMTGSYQGPPMNANTRNKVTGYNPDTPANDVEAYGWTQCQKQDNKNGKTGCRRHNRNIYNYDASGKNNRFFGHYSYGQFRWHNGRPSVYVNNRNIIAPVCAKLDQWSILGITFDMKLKPVIVSEMQADGTLQNVTRDKLHYMVKFLYGVEGQSTYNDTRNPGEENDPSLTRAAWHHNEGDDFSSPPTYFDPSPLGLGTQGVPPGNKIGPVDPETGLLNELTAFFGDIAEVVVFKRSLPEAEGNIVYEALHAKYFAPTPSPTPYPTESPTDSPTESPTDRPTAHIPTPDPTESPTPSPTESPTYSPTNPTPSPTPSPTFSPTFPTPEPTYDWGTTKSPTPSPSLNVSSLGTGSPTLWPTYAPTVATIAPTEIPTLRPTYEWERYRPPPTPEPTQRPITPWPTLEPTVPHPTPAPTEIPTTGSPTYAPVPTPVPTFPTPVPTPAPSLLRKFKFLNGWVGLRVNKTVDCDFVHNMEVPLKRTVNKNVGLPDTDRSLQLEVYSPSKCRATKRRRLDSSAQARNPDTVVLWHFSLMLMNNLANDDEAAAIAANLNVLIKSGENGLGFASEYSTYLEPEEAVAVEFECAEGLVWIECPTCPAQYNELECYAGSTVVPTPGPTMPTPLPTLAPTFRPTSPTQRPTQPTSNPTTTALGSETLSPTLSPSRTPDDIYDAGDPVTDGFWSTNWWIILLAGLAVVVALLVCCILCMACGLTTYLVRKKKRFALRQLKSDELRSNRAAKMSGSKKHKGQIKAERLVAEAKQRRMVKDESAAGVEMNNAKNWTSSAKYAPSSDDDSDRDAIVVNAAEDRDNPLSFDAINPLKNIGNGKPMFELEVSKRHLSDDETDDAMGFAQLNPFQKAMQASLRRSNSKEGHGDLDIHTRMLAAIAKNKTRSNDSKKVVVEPSLPEPQRDDDVVKQVSVRDRLQQQRSLLLAKVRNSSDVIDSATDVSLPPLKGLSMPAEESISSSYRSPAFDAFKASVRAKRTPAKSGRRDSFANFTAALDQFGGNSGSSSIQGGGETLAEQRAKLLRMSRRQEAGRSLEEQQQPPGKSQTPPPLNPKPPLNRLQNLRAQIGGNGPASSPQAKFKNKSRRDSFVDFSAALNSFGGALESSTTTTTTSAPPLQPLTMIEFKGPNIGKSMRKKKRR
jgi:hypothetical protein